MRFRECRLERDNRDDDKEPGGLCLWNPKTMDGMTRAHSDDPHKSLFHLKVRDLTSESTDLFRRSIGALHRRP